jgi:Uma2 family endonuclease
VEVLSPSTRSFDVLRKREDYSRVGVQELWLIDPEPLAAQLYRRGGGELELVEELDQAGTLTSPLLPGFAVPLARLRHR